MFVLLLVGVFSASLQAATIQDNSFLIEEAYNQEPGVVQFIQSYRRYEKSKDWEYQFTNEWPLGDETHQFSYVIPVRRFEASGNQGLGDIYLNYRYQMLKAGKVVMTPRFSLIVPTGDKDKGLGQGVLGLQVNQAISIELNDSFVTHWNMGLTLAPSAHEPAGNRGDLRSFNYGASLIYLMHEKANLMLEVLGTSDELLLPVAGKSYAQSFVFSPGVRFAIDTETTQFVPGVAVPIGFGPSEGERSYLAYLSIEPKLW